MSNNDIETIELHNGKYAKVSSRIKALHSEYDDARISTDYEFKQGWAICKATITLEVNDNPERYFTGHSMGEIDGDKAFEKLESVAVGRALANAGFLATGEIATAEEMQKFNENQQESNDDNGISEDVEKRAKQAMADCESVEELRDKWKEMPDKVKGSKKIQVFKDETKEALTASEDDQD